MRFVPLSFALVVFFAACASTPPVVKDPSGVDISLAQLTPGDIRIRYPGTNNVPSPYLDPQGNFNAKKFAFIVIDIGMTADRKAVVSLDSLVATGPDGSQIARFYDIGEYSDVMAGWQTDQGATRLIRAAIARSYLPSLDVPVHPGYQHYIAVLVSKYPVPLPYTVNATVNVGSYPAKIVSLVIDK
jgi:hypothetical protein